MTKQFSIEELEYIEKLASQHSYVEIAKIIKIPEYKFLELRRSDYLLQNAVLRGVAKRDKDFYAKQRKKKSEEVKRSKEDVKRAARSGIEHKEIDPLSKFKEEYEANKLRRLKKELSEIDIL